MARRPRHGGVQTILTTSDLAATIALVTKRRVHWRSSNPLRRARAGVLPQPDDPAFELEVWLKSELNRVWTPSWATVPTVPVDGDTAQRSDALLGKVCGPGCQLDGCADLRRLLTTKASSACGPSLRLEVFNRLRPFWAQLVYWKEIDELVQHARCTAHELFRTRAFASLAGLDSPGSVGPILRQAAEATYWGAAFMAGVAFAQSNVRKVVDARGVSHYRSKDIDDFVRGWMTVETERLADGWRALGHNTHVPAADEKLVKASNPTIAKMRRITRFAAAVIERQHTVSGLLPAVDRLDAACGYLDGLTHVTPTLISLEFSPPSLPQPHPPFRQLVATVLHSAARVLAEMVFAQRYDWSFVQLQRDSFPPHDHPGPLELAMVELPELRDMREQAFEVAFQDLEGNRVVVATGNKRPKSKK